MSEVQDLNSKCVHLWNISLGALNEPDYIGFLSEDELQKAGKYRYQKDRKKYVVGRGILRKLSAAYLGLDVDDIDFSYNKYGKPTFNFKSDFSFNLSNSGDRILIGFSKGSLIGVDMEEINRQIDHFELARSIFSNQEMEEWHKTAEWNQAGFFYDIWTKKEAYIKGCGYGLSVPFHLREITVLDHKVKIKGAWAQLPALLRSSWYVQAVGNVPDYKMAIAYNGRIDEVLFFNWE